MSREDFIAKMWADKAIINAHGVWIFWPNEKQGSYNQQQLRWIADEMDSQQKEDDEFIAACEELS